MERTVRGRIIPESFEDIVRQFRDRVYNQAYRMLGNREDAEEAAQDVFLRVHHSLDSFRGESALSTWVFRITANVCMNRLRKKQLRMVSLDKPVGGADGVVSDTIGDPKPGPFDTAAANQLAGQVRDRVRALPPAMAMAVSLYHFDGMAYEEIADVMGMPVNTVATCLHRARRTLAKQLADFQPAAAGPVIRKEDTP